MDNNSHEDEEMGDEYMVEDEFMVCDEGAQIAIPVNEFRSNQISVQSM